MVVENTVAEERDLNEKDVPIDSEEHQIQLKTPELVLRVLEGDVEIG